MASHNELGNRGEEVAVSFLENSGHEILSRNYRHGKAEIDIISKENNTIVFTEVKTRSTDFFGHPEEFVHRKKQKLMLRAAEEYLHQHYPEAEPRFDIISVLHKNGTMKVEHFKDAFFNLDNEEDDHYH